MERNPLVSIAKGAIALLTGLLLAGPAPVPSDHSAAVDNPDWSSKVRQQIEGAEYRPSRIEDGLGAPNRAHGLRVAFRDKGVEIAPRTVENGGSWNIAWRTQRWGRGERLAHLATDDVAPRFDGTRIVYTRGALDEWYVNTPKGIEQGFTIHERVAGNEPLVLVGRFDSGLRPTLRPDAGAVDLLDERGAVRLRYAELHVWDAGGREMSSRLGLEGNDVALVIDDSGARYPLTIDPLMTSPSWTAEPNQADAQFGLSVATAGDVNGDGFSDVIVGAEFYGLNGAAFLYLGSASGLATTPAWMGEPDSLGSGYGHQVAPAGDVNGDGYADVIVSDDLYSNGQDFEGRALVYHGSPSGLGASPAWAAESNQIGAVFGSSVATAGDVNGDGYADVIVGAYSYSNGQFHEGGAFVFHGSSTGLANTPAWTAESNVANALFGTSVATAGDVNGDGYADVIVGAERFNGGLSQEGKAFVYHGSATGLSAVAAWSTEGNQADALYGQSVSTAGDVNGDGYSDVIVGAPFYSAGQAAEGRAFIYMGAATGLNTVPIWIVDSNQANAFFGRCVATAGDVNGDGYADVIVGAWRFDNGETDEGIARIYPGQGTGPSPTPIWTGESNQADAWFGLSVATAGDVNGDGYSDVIVGAPLFSNNENQEGRAFVYHGSGAGLNANPGMFIQTNNVGAALGMAVGCAGDVNGDGYSDLFATAPLYDNVQFDEGRVSVHHGSSTTPSFFPSWTTESNQSFAWLGYVTGAAGAGDVNGDGFSDLIVGAPFFDNGQTDEGIARVHLGSPVGLQSLVFWSGESNLADAHYGISVASAGDVNGDGFGDVIVGADEATNGEFKEGRAYVYHGSPTGLTLAWTAEPNQENTNFGHSVAGAGDVNGDGYSDVIVGAQYYDAGQIDEGRVFVYLGSPTGLAATPAWTVESNQASAGLGHTVASAGDVNGDGYSDVIVGADFFGNGQGNEGRAEIYLGSVTGLAPTPVWSAESNQVTAGVGMSVACAGDVNGDGYSDVILGFPSFSNGQTDEGAAFLYHGAAAGPDTIPDWSAESNQASAGYGGSVASAGDVDGDGFSDVVVGASAFDDGESNEGYVFFYFGNLRDGLDRIPRQARIDDSGPIALLGRSNSESSFRLKMLCRTSAGRGNVRLQSEVKPLGTAFNGSGLVTTAASNTGAPVAGVSAVALSQPSTGLSPDRLHHWRSRIRTDSPFFPSSPWFSLSGNAPSEADLRTGDEVPRVLSIDDPSVVEGDAGTTQMVFTVAIDPTPISPVSVDYSTLDGTATVADGDYQATSGTLHFGPGQATAPITVTVYGDLLFEFDETFSVQLSNAQGASFVDALGKGTILRDSDPSGIELCPDFYVTDRPVEAIVEKDGIVYIGGGFREVGPATGGALPLDVTTAVPLGVPHVEGNVYAVAPDGSGGWYVGGNFTQVAGVPRQNIAHILPDHTPSAWNPSANGIVLTLAVSGGTVYAGGWFTQIGGQSRDHVAALDAATGNATSWNPDADGIVKAIAVSGSRVYVGGEFLNVGGQARPRIAAIDAVTGSSLPTWSPQANGAVLTILPSGGVVYAGGEFTEIGSSGHQFLAALDTTLGHATAWDPDAGGVVRALAPGPGLIYAGGDFPFIGGQPWQRIAALDVVNGLATTWGPEANAPVHALAVSGGTVFAGGEFTFAGGQLRNNVVAIDATTGAAKTWDPRANGAVFALAASGPTLYAGGQFTSAGGQQRRGVAALDAATGALTPWNPDVFGYVFDLEVDGNTVYAGGTFLSVGGVGRTNIAAINRTTGVATAWNPTADATVIDLCVDGGVVYAAGTFTAIGGAARNRIAALDASTGLASTWDPNANGTVYAIAVSDGVVYAGGFFSTVGGEGRNRIAALDASTGLATTWDPNANAAVRSIVVTDDAVYVGGEFTTIGGAARSRAAALALDSGAANGWNPGANNVVLALAAANGLVYAGGGFAQIGAQFPLNRLAALNTADGRAVAWAPEPSGGVYTIAPAGQHVYVGGTFSSIAGLARSNFACIRTTGATVGVPPTWASGVMLLRLSPNPAAGPTRIEYELPQAGQVRILVFDVRGRLVARPVDEVRPAGRHLASWSAESSHGRVGAGIYFVRLELAGRSITQRLVRLR